MGVKFLNRSIWQRLFGIPATKEPENKKIHGPNPKPVDTYSVKKDEDNLYIRLS